jgi:cobalt-zinc-cadmium efflux system outer membrane protein
MQRLSGLVLAVAFLPCAPAHAANPAPALDYAQALALARERAPRILAASARIDEARGQLTGASVLLRENPVLELAAGHRSSDEGSSFEGDVGVRQGLELGGRRRARIAEAEAGVERAGADRDDALRALLREVAAAFYAALAAESRLQLAAGSEGIAAEVARVAERRHRADEVPVLDLHVSRAALARARAERIEAEALSTAALGELRILLGMQEAEPVAVRGDLHDARRFELPELLARAGQRADLRALEAELRAAEAGLRLARAEAWPELGVGARYEREERADVVLGEVALTLPVFERGQGLRAESSARIRRLRLELDAARRAAGVEVETAFAVYTQRASAARELEAGALPLLDENEALARRSYEVGQIGLAELLFVRREVLDTRREHLERLLAAAIAAVDLEASAGVLP